MSRVRVVHCKRDPFDVYIGRPGPFGNPFTIGKEGDRAGVIGLYRAYFFDRVLADPVFLGEVRALAGKTLGCWCAPKLCHGDVIAEFLGQRTCPGCGGCGRILDDSDREVPCPDCPVAVS